MLTRAGRWIVRIFTRIMWVSSEGVAQSATFGTMQGGRRRVGRLEKVDRTFMASAKESGSPTVWDGRGSRTPPPPPTRTGAPPKWPAEILLDRIGAYPAAVGRALDRAAKLPVLGWGIWFFSSVWFGLLWLALIGLYVAIGSAVTSIRAHYEMTDLEFFDAWPMRVLLVLMCTTLICVTLRKVRLSLFKLGVWMVHIGILTLVLGCTLYFSQKFEGMVRIYLHKDADSYYDSTERALYVYKINPDNTLGTEAMVPLPGMPIYHERLPESGNPLDRTIPAADLAKLDPKLAGVPVVITGYIPDAYIFPRWTPGPQSATVKERAIGVSLTTGGVLPSDRVEWLVGTRPAARELASDRFVVEYLYHPSAARIATLKEPFAGQGGLTVRVPKRNITKTYGVKLAAPFKVEGTPYSLMPHEYDEPRELITPGYEDAASDGLFVVVSRDDGDGKSTTFRRDVVARFPEVSSDFVMVNGKEQRQRGGLYDPDIELTFHDASIDHMWVIEDEAGALSVIHRFVGGAVETQPLTVGEATNVTMGPMRVELTITGTTNNAITATRAEVVPETQRGRKSNVGAWLESAALVIRVGEGPSARKVYVPFTPFAQTSVRKGRKREVGRQPELVEIPGAGVFGFMLATTRHPLPATIRLDSFDYFTQGSTSVPKDFVSHLTMWSNTDGRLVNEKQTFARLNEPAMRDGLAYFQAQWDGETTAPEADRYTVLGVGNRPGINIMVFGCALMLLGILYAFYLKPYLLERKKKDLALWSMGVAA
jgi:hypothetical protein